MTTLPTHHLSILNASNTQLRYDVATGWSGSAKLLQMGIKVCSCGYFNPHEVWKCKKCGEEIFIVPGDEKEPVFVGVGGLKAAPVRIEIVGVRSMFFGNRKHEHKLAVVNSSLSEDNVKKKHPEYVRMTGSGTIQYWTPAAIELRNKLNKPGEEQVKVYKGIRAYKESKK